MVDVTGHLAMALLFAAPAWLVWGRRGALGFTGFALVTAMLPDTDLVLQQVFPITHHGVTHTMVFVLLLSILVGAAVAKWLTPRFAATRWIRSTNIASETVFVFATAGWRSAESATCLRISSPHPTSPPRSRRSGRYTRRR